jgi:hypothetical protein
MHLSYLFAVPKLHLHHQQTKQQRTVKYLPFHRLLSMAEPIIAEKALHQIAVAFKDLANTVSNSQTAEVEVAPFSHACSLISPLFGSLGFAFKFAEMDFVAKVISIRFFIMGLINFLTFQLGLLLFLKG